MFIHSFTKQNFPPTQYEDTRTAVLPMNGTHQLKTAVVPGDKNVTRAQPLARKIIQSRPRRIYRRARKTCIAVGEPSSRASRPNCRCSCVHFAATELALHAILPGLFGWPTCSIHILSAVFCFVLFCVLCLTVVFAMVVFAVLCLRCIIFFLTVSNGHKMRLCFNPRTTHQAQSPQCVHHAERTGSASVLYHERGRPGAGVRTACSSDGCLSASSARLPGSYTLESMSANLCATPSVWLTVGGNAAFAVTKASSRAIMACCADDGLILISNVNAPTLSPRTHKRINLECELSFHRRSATRMARPSSVC